MTPGSSLGSWFIPVLLIGSAASAKTSLGIFGDWGAFSEPDQGRCYAIAQAQPDARQRERQPYLTVTTWPRHRINGQLYWQLARTPATPASVSIRIGGRTYRLRTDGSRAWAQDPGMDAAIRAAMRSSDKLSVYYRDNRQRQYSERYRLRGAATAFDAATLACARK